MTGRDAMTRHNDLKPANDDDVFEVGAPLRTGRLDEILGFHLRMANVAIYQDYTAAMGDIGLTQKQFAVLELIAANPKVSQIDIANQLSMDRATMMALVNRLGGAAMDFGNAYLQNAHLDIEPVPGQLVVFPSWLPHQAMPYHGSADRVIVSFNVSVHAAGGSDQLHGYAHV